MPQAVVRGIRGLDSACNSGTEHARPVVPARMQKRNVVMRAQEREYLQLGIREDLQAEARVNTGQALRHVAIHSLAADTHVPAQAAFAALGNDCKDASCWLMRQCCAAVCMAVLSIITASRFQYCMAWAIAKSKTHIKCAISKRRNRTKQCGYLLLE